MIIQILKIRIKQTYRVIYSIGFFRIIIVALLFLLLFSFIYSNLQQELNGIIAIIFLIAIVFFIHTKRKDKVFLFTINNNPRLIYLVEYLTFTAPIFIMLLFVKRYDLILYQIVGISFVALLKISIKLKKENLNNKLLELIPYNCFEIKSGVRNNFYSLISINLIGIIFGFWIGTAPIIIFINTLIFSGFYQICEPRNIIERKEQKINKFILNKIISNLKIFAIIQIPVSTLFLLFNYQHYIILLSILVVSFLFIILSILLKYALYFPNANLRANSIILSIALFMLPIIFFMILAYYYKANKNLKHYIDDYT